MSRFARELRTAVRPRRQQELVAAGITAHVLAGPRWRRTARGWHVPAAVERTPAQRIVEAAAGLPSEALLGGWAAAYALGTDRLDGFDDHTVAELPVPVVMPVAIHRRSTHAVRYRQEQVSAEDRRWVGGVPVTSAARTAVDLARWAPGLVEAVVGIDAVLQALGVAPADLQRALTDTAGRPGTRRARSAVALARPRTGSTWESRLRMVWVLDLGLPSPEVNAPVYDRDGQFLGAPDLLDPEAGLAMEYDGAHWTGSRVDGGHRNRDQHRADNVREERLERAGLVVVRADKTDVTRGRRDLVRRLLDARGDGLRRNRSRDRWTLVPPANAWRVPA